MFWITSIHQKWMVLFGLWFVVLSGVFHSPGMLQAIELHRLLNHKKNQFQILQKQVQSLQKKVHALETQESLQIKEIRRILGYVAENEIVFDFMIEDPYENR